MGNCHTVGPNEALVVSGTGRGGLGGAGEGAFGEPLRLRGSRPEGAVRGDSGEAVWGWFCHGGWLGVRREDEGFLGCPTREDVAGGTVTAMSPPWVAAGGDTA